MFGFKRSMVQLVLFLTWAVEYFTFGSPVLWFTYMTLLAISVVLALLTYDHDYWVSRGVFSPPALPGVGHIMSVVMFKEQGGLCFKRIYDTYKKERFLGTHQFYQRTLVIRDPALIKRVCVADFNHFVDRGFFFNKDVDPLAGSVLFLRGNEWKKLRAKISPIFSPNKLRGMFPLIDNTACEFVVRIENMVAKDKCNNNNKNKQNNKINYNSHTNHNNDKTNEENTINEKSYSKDVKSNGSYQKYGSKDEEIHYNNSKVHITNYFHKQTYDYYKYHDSKFLVNNGVNKKSRKEDIYIERDKEALIVVDSEKLVGGYTADAIVPCAFGIKSNVMENENDPFAVALYAFYEMSWFNIFEKTMRQFWPAFSLFFRMRIIPKKTHDFFYNIVTSVLRAREKGEQEKRGDFIDMMMSLRSDTENNNNVNDDDDVEITDMVISANAFIIFLGGFETTSGTLAFLLLELAAHPEVQEKMRQEIKEVLEKNAGKICYEVLHQLTYMEMVIQETLRLYPPFPSIQRMCTKDYLIPQSSVVIERGTIVLFPTLGIQRDEQYFENASSFIPERWEEGRSQPAPGVYMPFGDGPRYCIGKRFAMIQMKCCLIRLLQRVRIRPAPHSPARSGPFAADPRSPLTLHPIDSDISISILQ